MANVSSEFIKTRFYQDFAKMTPDRRLGVIETLQVLHSVMPEAEKPAEPKKAPKKNTADDASLTEAVEKAKQKLADKSAPLADPEASEEIGIDTTAFMRD